MDDPSTKTLYTFANVKFGLILALNDFFINGYYRITAEATDSIDALLPGLPPIIILPGHPGISHGFKLAF